MNELINSLVQQVVPIVGLLLMSLIGTVIVPAVLKKLKLENDAVVRQYLETALRNGLTIAMQKIAGTNPTPQQVEDATDAVIELAASYVNASVPQALAHFNLDKNQIAQMLLARLPTVTAAVAKAADAKIGLPNTTSAS